MYYVYVLGSTKNLKRYVGFTQKNPTNRLSEHNFGSNAWTRANRPFKLVYSEKILTKQAALKREKFLKSAAGRRLVHKILGP
jgi:putative endonuclease